MATKANLVIDQGTTFSTVINLTDENGDALLLTNFQSESKIKKWYTSQNYITVNTTINVGSGSITLYLDSNTTSNMESGRYVYDVNLIDTTSNVVSRVVEGIVTVTPAVTVGNFSTNNTWYANGYTDG